MLLAVSMVLSICRGDSVELALGDVHRDQLPARVERPPAGGHLARNEEVGMDSEDQAVRREETAELGCRCRFEEQQGGFNKKKKVASRASRRKREERG